MKVRMSRGLYERARVCAEDVGEPVGRWMGLCLREVNRRKVAEWRAVCGVAMDGSLLVATRGESVVATVAEVEGVGGGEVREAVAEGVLFCEARMCRRAPVKWREGVDYVLGGEGDW